MDPNETIDLCDSDTEPEPARKVSPSCSSGVGAKSSSKDCEVITLEDDDSFSIISDKTESLSINGGRPSPKRTSFLKGLKNQENEDDIEVIAVQINNKNKGRQSLKKKAKTLQFGSLSSTTVFRGISSNTRVGLKGSKGRRKKKVRGGQGVSDSGNEGPVTTTKKQGKKKKKRVLQTPTRGIILRNPQSPRAKQARQMINNNLQFKKRVFQPPAAPLKRAPTRVRGVPIENGKPKFRMEPVPTMPNDQLLKEAAMLFPEPGVDTEVTLPKTTGPERTVVQETLTGDNEDCDTLTITCPVNPSSSSSTSSASVAPAAASSEVPAAESSSVAGTQDPPSLAPLPTLYGTNYYNSGHVQNRAKGSKRPIVIDGSNVAFGHGNSHKFSCQGIKICSSYFVHRGHEVVVFVPKFRMKHRESVDAHVLQELEKSGIVKFTPSREVDGERICSYDDRFVVQYAADNGGIIVSNDNFRDLYDEQPLWRDTIRTRILQYTWVNENYIMFPPDPLGPRGPNLDQFLLF